MNTLYWIEELLPFEVMQKKMQDGVGYYLNEKFVLFLTEDSKTTVYRGKSYQFQLYFGAFFPIVKLKHNAVIAKFPFLENHPVKKEWLYIPAENENFEEEVKLVLREVLKGNPLFGIPVQETAAEKRARFEAEGEISDPRKPSLFNTNAPKAKVRKKAEPKKEKPKSEPTLEARARKKKAKTSKKAENTFLLSITRRSSK
ncbi:hypothetical protein [Pseudobdellovibrio sp. HCB154]|uniref:hypothetical protein n=1 Tax=Pseudobdellovibrio sp. HCB154 TaxID=3386277 RepID=UPI003917482D